MTEIHKKNPLVTIHLLVALARFFNISQTIPNNVSVQVSVIKVCLSEFQNLNYFFDHAKICDLNVVFFISGFLPVLP